jgi:hypothetical protein
MRRARWLESLPGPDRDGLADVPLHEVEARYLGWCAREAASAEAAAHDLAA